MAKRKSQRRKTIKKLDSLAPKIRETGSMTLRPRNGKKSQQSQSPPIFGFSNLGAVYEAINFNATNQTVKASEKAPADSEIQNDRLSPPLFDDSESSVLEETPSPPQEQTENSVEQSAIDIVMTLKTPSPPEGITGTQHTDSTTQTEPLELAKVDASTNTEPQGINISTNTQPHTCDASTDTADFLAFIQSEKDGASKSVHSESEHSDNEHSDSEHSESGVSYYESTESETDLEDFHSDVSSIEEEFIVARTSGSEPDTGSVNASPPRTLVYVNQQFHSPESAKLLKHPNV